MSFTTYATTAVIAFIGLILGSILAFIAPEELKPGERYFILFSKVIFLVALIYFMLFNKTNIHLTIIFSVIFAFIIYFKEINSVIAYLILGAIFYSSYRDTAMFFAISGLIFIYGLFTGTLFVYKNMGEKRIKIIARLILNHIIFLVAVLPLYFSNL